MNSQAKMSDEEVINVTDGKIEDGRSGFWFCILDIDVMQNKELSFFARGIYALLATYVNTKDRSWCLKIDTIAEVAGISRRQTQYALKELAERGYIEVSTVFEGGRQKASKYTLIGHDAVQKFTEEDAPKDIECTTCTPENGIGCTTCTPGGACGAHRLLKPLFTITKDKDMSVDPPENPEKKKAERAKTDYSAEFENFWKEYPHYSRRKSAAYSEWRRLLKLKIAPDVLIRAAKRYASECRAQCTEKKYTLHAASFLGPKKEAWRDYIGPEIQMGREINDDIDIEKFRMERGQIDAIAYERARRGLSQKAQSSAGS
ncbi:MAG: helix-turn-helix domain-containing protein [Synergistaceae bacterium]|nr:helix-turn-helix domain-containing protein [Synergistaceae bacterium]